MKKDELGGLLWRARREQGLTQLALSELSGVGATVIYKVESGRTDVTLESFLAVCHALGVDLRCQSPLGEEVGLNG